MDTNTSISELKKDLYEIQHMVLSNQEDDVKLHSMQKLRKYLVEDECYSSVRFCDVLMMMLDRLNASSPAWQYYSADDFFLKSNTLDSFLALVHHFGKTDVNEDKVADLLEKFIVSSNLNKLFLDQCTVLEQNDSWDEIIVCFASLPERAANKFKTKTRDAFCPIFYIGYITQSIFAVLQNVKIMLTLEKDVNLEFLSRLLGKLCLVGYADILFDSLYPQLIHVMECDFLWRRICQRLICGVPQRCMESVLVALLQNIAWYGHVEWNLGESVIYKQNIQYLLTTKFMTLRYFEKDLLPQNVIGYLAHSEKRKSLFHKVVLLLLDVWSDGSALKHQPYSNQRYLSRLLMIATGHLKRIGLGTWRQDFMEKLLNGVHNRIASSQPSVRILGMVVGEALSSVLNYEGPELKFEYEENQETAYLISLLVIPEDPKLNSEEVKEVNGSSNEEEEDTNIKEDNVISTCDGDLDSDDDLEPYDLTNDKADVKKQPLYLMECLKGLMDQEKPEWVQTCLECTERLIRQKPDNLNEVAIDLCKVLLHQENHYALQNFASLKQGSLVALCVHCPVLIAEFLSREFYDRNYSIRQRVDILQVLSVASAELSGVENMVNQNKHAERSNKVTGEDPQSCIEENWKAVVAKRIADKTRVISKKRKELLPKENKFASVAGYFFFTLLACFDGMGTVADLLGSDSYLLGHFIYTLGIIMHSAHNIPIAGQMGKCLLEFIWALKYHKDVFVQKALLFSLSMVISSVPTHMLVSDLKEDVFECNYWLQSIINESIDPESKMVASEALALLQKCLREEGILPHSVTKKL